MFGVGNTLNMFDKLLKERSDLFGRSDLSGPEKTAGELAALLGESADVQRRRVRLGRGGTAELLWLDGLADERAVSEELVRPLSALPGALRGAAAARACLAGNAWRCAVRRRTDVTGAAEDVLAGAAAAVFAPGEILTFAVKAAVGRPVGAPTVERSVLGSREAFTETMRVNTALVRRRLPTAALRLRELTASADAPGRLTVVWLDDRPGARAFAGEVLRRLSAGELGAPLSSGALERRLAGTPRGLLPQVLHTERPDRFAAELLRGKAGVLCDGLPLGFLVPGTVPEMLRVQEDESRHAGVARALTLLRWAALALALLLPAVYVAAAVHHPELLPLKLLLSVIRAKEQVPFSTAGEVLAMLFSFELLQEAGIRLPESVGQTVSIIGALIVGQCAVEAKVLSPIVIIVVAAAGIAGYTLPSQELAAAVRLWRPVLVALAAALGLFGVAAALLAMLLRLGRTENMGVSCLYPMCDGPERRKRRGGT